MISFSARKPLRAYQGTERSLGQANSNSHRCAASSYSMVWSSRVPTP